MSVHACTHTNTWECVHVCAYNEMDSFAMYNPRLFSFLVSVGVNWAKVFHSLIQSVGSNCAISTSRASFFKLVFHSVAPRNAASIIQHCVARAVACSWPPTTVMIISKLTNVPLYQKLPRLACFPNHNYFYTWKDCQLTQNMAKQEFRLTHSIRTLR